MNIDGFFEFYFAYLSDYQIYPHIVKNKFLSLKHNFKALTQLLFGKENKVIFHNYNGQFCYPVFKNPKVFNSRNEEISIKEFSLILEMDYYYQYSGIFPFKSKKRILGVYTENYPHSGDNFDYHKGINIEKFSRLLFFDTYIKKYDFFIVGSKNLKEIYSHFTENIEVVNNVLEQHYFESDIFENHKDQNKFVVGWTGNPNREFKGFYKFIKPAIDELNSEGLKIELKTKFSGPYEELYNFFNDVNLLIVASEGDCGPAVFAHASLSNIPSVSTKIGWPNDVIIDGVNGFFCDRNIPSIKEKVKILYHNRKLLSQFSNKIRKDYKIHYDNSVLTENFKNVLLKVLKS
ncbi:MAG: glycosyltransferase [Crocinitomicaceae bacterium]|nr:glycosyltransferase [Crocinitomicaceae bacterium]